MLGMVRSFDSVEKLLAVNPGTKLQLGLAASARQKDVQLLRLFGGGKGVFGAGLVLVLGLPHHRWRE